MPAFGEQVRSLRLIHQVLSLAVVVLVTLGEILGPQERTPNPAIAIVFAVQAAALAGVSFFLQRNFSSSALDVLQKDPENNAALMRWRAGQLIPMVLAEAVALLGFALRFLGAPVIQAAPFYVGSVLLFLYFRPSEPSV